MVFKKGLTPLSKRGRVVKHQGKGGLEQRLRQGDRDTVTAPDSFSRATNAYPKAPMSPVPPTMAPSLGGPALGTPAPAQLGVGVDEEPTV
jgi:hypothetical protein